MGLAVDQHDLGRDITVASLKAAPAAAVVVAESTGLSLEQWVFILTIVYLLLQISFLVWKWVATFLRARRATKLDEHRPFRFPQDE